MPNRLSVIALLALALPSIARAQVTLMPVAGAYIPASDLDGVQSGASAVKASRDGTLALGLNLGVGPLRGSAVYASGSTIKGANSADLGKGTVLAVAVDIVIRPIPRALVQPYLLGGLGFKNTSYDPATGASGALPASSREAAIHAGFGADLMLGGLGVMAEITDFVSKNADGKLGLHDAFLMAGLRLRF
jgi:hypothetical protein